MRNKKSRQFSRSSVMYIVFGIALVGVMTLFGASAFLGVNYFVINGAVTYTPEEIIDASGVSRGNNLLYLNIRTVEQNIRKELPYISSVEISRDLPDTLTITVTESKPVAYILFSGDIVIIDSSGRVLDIIQSHSMDITNLIEVRGVLLSDAKIGNMLKSELGVEQYLSAMQNVLASMEKEGIANDINYLDVSNINNISFGYLGMYRVIVGGVGELRIKLNRLPSDIRDLKERYPNTRGVYNMTDESRHYIFTPE